MSDPTDPTRTTAPGAADAAATASFTASAQPYTDFIPYARGGLGEVLRATDPALNRTVAVKRLLDKRAADPDSCRRFLIEAEVTARLEHPGVVPVYGLFADDRGGPAYAMRFVQGPTLWDALKGYHAGPPDPVAFRRLLQSFLQVCQTVAYAHSRGVIHRDLKPQNVILGKFGETLVVDWGLAKVVGRSQDVRMEALEEETLLPGSGGSGDETAMGSAVGTPAFMSPEQAAGRWNVIDHRSDVYGLGAVLYTVLAGQAPLERGDWPEMQQKIQRGEIVPPRAVKGEVPRPLEAICRKAMAVRPEDRYQSAADLAVDIEHWLADEPVTAYREPLASRVRRWAKRNRTLVGAAGVLLVSAVVGLSIGAALLQRARVETDRERTAAVAAQRKAEALNRFLIDDLLKQADPVNNPAGDKITVLELLDKAAARLDEGTALGGQPEVEAELRGVVGHAYEYLGFHAKAGTHYRRAWELLAELRGPDHPAVLAAHNRYIYTLGARGLLDEAEPAAAAAYDRCSRLLGEADPETAEAANNLAEVRLQQHRFAEAVALRRLASRIYHANRGPHESKTLEIDSDLAVALVKGGERAEAVPLLKSVVERRRATNPRHPEYPVALSNLGGALIALGRFAEAEGVIREALALSLQLKGKDDQLTLATRNLLAYTLEGHGRWAEAEAEYLAVLADRRRVEAESPQNPLAIRRSLAFTARMYGKQRKWRQAAPYLAELILLVRPDPTRTKDTLAVSLASALCGEAEPAAAEPVLRECAEALRPPLTWSGDWLAPEVASRYGDALRRQGKCAAAEPILTTAAADIEKAVGVPVWGVSEARARVAALYEAWGKPEKAAQWKAPSAGKR